MSEVLCSRCKRHIEQPNEDLTERMGELSVTSNETSSTKNLSDMPTDVVGLIIERSDHEEQMKLRKVSKSLRELVDKHKPACETIRIICVERGVHIEINDLNVMYTCYVTGFDDLNSTLKNPRLQLNEFNFVFNYNEENRGRNANDREDYNNLLRILEPLNHQLSVKELDVSLPNPSTLLSILPYLKPGYLKYITLYFGPATSENEGNRRIDPTGMDQVAILEQWKQAEEINLEDCFDIFPMEYATHFKRFHIYESAIDVDTFIRIREYLSKLQNLEQCTFSSPRFGSNFDFVPQVLGTPVSSNATEMIFHYPIPNSNYYLEFTKPIKSCDYEIKKKKREDN